MQRSWVNCAHFREFSSGARSMAGEGATGVEVCVAYRSSRMNPDQSGFAGRPDDGDPPGARTVMRKTLLRTLGRFRCARVFRKGAENHRCGARVLPRSWASGRLLGSSQGQLQMGM